ncbi:MAG: hypothetical protein AVDCRST_MAG76-3842 [uncultured Acidimicrobiales bacterium]|uniref:cytochrome-c oxidase n=1 Tax=uncultured Acidimicrobiales bacterium TaxID=310071 RepID=A0A6J4JJA2_9ACTN|nr:MAG: hypothetical protein AVDCRST_MAG76-3842 [uncultured Acidimicrobiales bacterium]
MKIVGWSFVVLASLVATKAVIYWFTSSEAAGTTMLVLAACLAAFIGGYLALTARRATAHGAGEAERDPYLPHASGWPFFVGVAALVTFNGLAIGMWALVPGLLALAIALTGYAAQSRRRG